MKSAQERLAAVLRHLKIENPPSLGRGMTSALFDIGGGRVLKIHNGPQEEGYLLTLQHFSQQLQCHAFPFAVPLIYEYGAVADVHYHIERRLPGQDLAQVFPSLTTRERQRSLSSLVDALLTLHAIQWPRHSFGEPLNSAEQIAPPKRGRATCARGSRLHWLTPTPIC